MKKQSLWKDFRPLMRIFSHLLNQPKSPPYLCTSVAGKCGLESGNIRLIHTSAMTRNILSIQRMPSRTSSTWLCNFHPLRLHRAYTKWPVEIPRGYLNPHKFCKGTLEPICSTHSLTGVYFHFQQISAVVASFFLCFVHFVQFFVQDPPPVTTSAPSINAQTDRSRPRS